MVDSPTRFGAATGDSSSPVVGPGDVIGGFRILSLAGAGGMGVVFEALDPNLGRPVALKLIAPELAADPHLRELFLREAQAAAAIEHPNVVPVYRAGDDAGRLFIAMRFIRGITLREIVEREAPLAPGRTANLTSQIASALDAAHSRGLIHGDVKPANIIVTDSGGEEHAYLTDFGLSGLSAGLAQRAGTVGYLSPERQAGGAADAQSDIYALGCVLAECLTGRPAGPMSSSDLGVGIPPGAQDVVARALAAESATRYASAGDLANAARRLRHETVVLAADASREDALRGWLAAAGVLAWNGGGPLADALRSSAGCVLAVGAEGLGWAREHLATLQELSGRDPGLRLVAALLPGATDPDPTLNAVAGWPWVDLREAMPDDWGALLARAVRGGGTVPAQPTNQDICPYQGLDAFGEGSTDFFVGRETEVDRILDLMRASRFVAVAGASGSGKSSLIHAGLLPAIRRGGIPGRSDWRIATMTPGGHPLQSLVAAVNALAPQCDLDEDALLASATRLDEALVAGGAPALLVVDQFEEIFTLCASESERSRVIEALVYAATVPEGPLRLVIGMRADFYDRCAHHPRLRALVNDHQFLVGPLAQGALRRIVEEPARRVGLIVEPGLARTIVEDVGDRPGELPLVSHLLFELWRRRNSGLLTNEAYAASGGVEGALARRAEDVFGDFGETRQRVARRVLLRLVQPGEGTEDTRRRAAIAELETGPTDAKAVNVVVEALADARLLSVGRDAATGHPTAEIAHEALIRSWPRLRAWINEDRDALRAQQRIADAADEWNKSGRDDDLLLRGGRLAVAQERPPADPNPIERDFLTASAERAGRDVAARRRRMRITVGSLSAGVVAVAAVAGFALLQRNSAARERDAALSRQVAGSASDQLSTDPELALLLGRVAYATEPTKESEEVLRQAIHDSAVRLTYAAHTGPLTDAVYGKSGRWVATSSEDGTIRVWNPRNGRTLEVLPDHGRPVRELAADPHSNSILSVGDDGSLRRWNLSSDGRLLSKSIVMKQGSALSALDVGRSGTIAVGSKHGELWVLDAQSHRPRLLKGGAAGEIADVSLDRTGRALAVAVGSRAQLWQVGGGKPPLTIFNDTTGSIVSSVRVSADGHRVLMTGAFARLWDRGRLRKPVGVPSVLQPTVAEFGPRPGELHVGFLNGESRLVAPSGIAVAILRGHSGAVNAYEVAPDGQTALTASGDGTARLWAVRGDSREMVLPAGDYIPAGVNTPGGGRSAVRAVLTNGQLLEWSPGRQSQRFGKAIPGAASFAIEPKSQNWAVGYTDGSVRLRDRTGMDRLIRPSQGNTRTNTWIKALVFSADGKQVLAGTYGGLLYSIALEGQAANEAKIASAPTEAIASDPAGGGFATASDDGVRIWKNGSNSPGSPLGGHVGPVNWLAYSRDGTLLATVGRDRTLRIWGTDQLSAERVLPLPLEPIGVAFSQDGLVIAVTDAESVTLWDWRRGVRLVRIPSPQSVDVTFTDGEHLAVVGFRNNGQRQALREFRCDVCNTSAELPEFARSRSTRDLRGDERRAFLVGVSQ